MNEVSGPRVGGPHAVMLDFLDGDIDYLERWRRLIDLMKRIRTSAYSVTNACNLRCKGCWFFEYDLDKRGRDARDLDFVADFVKSERRRGMTHSLLFGGEPSLFPDKVAVFVEHMDYVSVATNGLKRFPLEGFENVALLVAVFGGRSLDDELRAIKPGGRRFTGLFDTSLRNYRNDPRAFYLYAIAEDGIGQIDETVKRIADNGNRLNYSFYSKYDTGDPLRVEDGKRLLDEALRVKQRYPDTVVSHPYFVETMITGRSHWGEFGYDVCPSISANLPAHSERLANGNPILPGMRTWASDMETVNFCCTSGHCDGCRDSLAVASWLLVNLHKFRRDKELLKTWIGIAESFWSQYVWSPYGGNRSDPANVLPARQKPAAYSEMAGTGPDRRATPRFSPGNQAARASR